MELKKESNSNSKKKKTEWKVGYQTLEGWGKLGKVAKRVKLSAVGRTKSEDVICNMVLLLLSGSAVSDS